jgi:hypothetical protein
MMMMRDMYSMKTSCMVIGSYDFKYNMLAEDMRTGMFEPMLPGLSLFKIFCGV